jgi:4-phytase/acid phosphatase/peptide/nickel transport system substrate-binding protein
VVSGDADIVWDDEADNILKARKDPNLTVREYTGSGAVVEVFNTKKPPLDDVRVRRALRMAVDMDAFAKAYSQGLRKPAKDPYGEGSFVQCKDPKTLPHDPAQAKALLAEYGKPADFRFMVTATPRGRFIGQIFQEMWKDVGVNVVLDEVDQTTLVTKAFTGDFQLSGWRIIDLADPDPQMYANFHTGSPVNLARYSNPEVDKLLDEARSTADRGTRSKSYCRIAQVLNQEVPWWWILENNYFSISRANLKGVHKQYSDTVDVADAYWEKK